MRNFGVTRLNECNFTHSCLITLKLCAECRGSLEKSTIGDDIRPTEFRIDLTVPTDIILLSERRAITDFLKYPP